MKKIIAGILALVFTAGLVAGAEHPIPPDSKHNWDYRGPPRTLSNESYVKLFSCKTYEELRDTLILAIEDLENSADCAAPHYVASSCRLALIRTYYLLGDIENADRLLERYSSVHRGADGSLDLSSEPLRPVKKEEAKPAEGGKAEEKKQVEEKR